MTHMYGIKKTERLNKHLLLHNFWTRKLVREMDGLDLVSMVGDIMNHLKIIKPEPDTRECSI